MARTPWIGLAALVAMFAIPFLPDWLFTGPRTVKRWPRRQVCGACGAPWTDEHQCSPAPRLEADGPVRAELRRLDETRMIRAGGPERRRRAPWRW
jgi:hypothetical protein